MLAVCGHPVTEPLRQRRWLQLFTFKQQVFQGCGRGTAEKFSRTVSQQSGLLHFQGVFHLGAMKQTVARQLPVPPAGAKTLAGESNSIRI